MKIMSETSKSQTKLFQNCIHKNRRKKQKSFLICFQTLKQNWHKVINNFETKFTKKVPPQEPSRGSKIPKKDADFAVRNGLLHVGFIYNQHASNWFPNGNQFYSENHWFSTHPLQVVTIVTTFPQQNRNAGSYDNLYGSSIWRGVRLKRTNSASGTKNRIIGFTTSYLLFAFRSNPVWRSA